MCIIIVYFDFILSSAGSKDTSLVNLAAAHAGKENLSFQLPLTCIHLMVGVMHAYVIVIIHVAYQSNTVLKHSVAMHTTLVLFVGPIKINFFPILTVQ